MSTTTHVYDIPHSGVESPKRRIAYRNNKSGYNGVYFHKQTGKWAAQSRLGGKPKHMGLFDCPKAAFKALKGTTTGCLPKSGGNTKTEIPLTNGQVTLVDKQIHGYLSKWTWLASEHHTGKYYARRTEYIEVDRGKRKQKTIIMARVIMEYHGYNTTDKQVDHINGNTLDNRLENLRLCSNTENQCNKHKNKNNTSGYKGVCFDRRRNKWVSKIGVNYKKVYLGAFNTPEEAAVAYNEAALQHHKEFAKLNGVENDL